jgi:hypothetical protein
MGMSESDPRVENKGNAIEVRRTDDKMEVVDERSDWIGSSTALDKIGRVMGEEGNEFLLPKDADGNMNWIKDWVPKAAATMNRNKVFERKEGRTGLETWAMPLNYAFIEGSMGSGGAEDMLRVDSDVHSRGIDIAVLIYDELSIHGRETIDEIIRNIGAVEPQLLTVVINSMLKDKFLVPYAEPDGLKTLELVEAHTRNNMLGLIPTPTPELEDKETERNIGGTPDRPEDVVTTYQFEESEIPVMDSPEDLKRNKFKLGTTFEQ